ncbi:hypothetical protein ACWGQ5_40580 [Streptomyces sp. NPDC055722]
MRRDLSPLRAADEAMAEPKLRTAGRTDLVCDRTRASNRCAACWPASSPPSRVS